MLKGKGGLVAEGKTKYITVEKIITAKDDNAIA